MPCHTPLILEEDGARNTLSCGKCPVCINRRVDQWAFRMREEDRVSSSSFFFTFTYADGKATVTKNKFLTLDKNHWKFFIRRLRREEKGKIKYKACGEYGGSKTYGRPHFHAIMFNVDPEDFEFLGYDGNGFKKWRSEKMIRIWSHGNVDIGQVTSKSTAYIMKYLDKKHEVPLHSRDDRVVPYDMHSRGLGEAYVLDEGNVRYHKENLGDYTVSNHEGKRVVMPRYYREKLFTPEEINKQNIIILEKMNERSEEMRENFDINEEKFTFDEYVYRQKVAVYKKTKKRLAESSR